MTIEILIGLTFAVNLCSLLCYRIAKVKQNRTLYPKIGLILSLALFLFMLVTLYEMKTKGVLYHDNWQTIDILEFYEHRNKTLIQDVTEETDLPQKTLIVLYRYHCSDCEKNHDALKNIKQTMPVRYVESKSPLGKKLVKRYNVLFVPSILLYDKTSNRLEHLEVTNLAESKEEQQKLQAFQNALLPSDPVH